jgi:hypothetical protein
VSHQLLLIQQQRDRYPEVLLSLSLWMLLLEEVMFRSAVRPWSTDQSCMEMLIKSLDNNVTTYHVLTVNFVCQLD